MRKDKLIAAMEAAGYWYDTFASDDDRLVFRSDNGFFTMTMDDWDEVEDWLEGVVFDDPEVAEAVDLIMHPDHYGKGAR